MTTPDANAEALRRYNSDVDAETGASVDDWGYAETERRAFVAGAEWALGAGLSPLERLLLDAGVSRDSLADAAAAVTMFFQPGKGGDIVPLDPKPWYVVEADEGQGPDAGRYSMADYWADAAKGEYGGTMSNLAIWRPREGFAQPKSMYLTAPVEIVR